MCIRDSNISAEATTRSNADSALTSQINNVILSTGVIQNSLNYIISSTGALAGELSAEASVRSAADVALAGNISAEATTRSNADSALSLSTVAIAGTVTAEAATRSSADSALSGQISAEAITRFNADQAIGVTTGTLRTDLAIEGSARQALAAQVAIDTTTLGAGIVHLAGAETITGAKTFTAAPTVSNVALNLTGPGGNLVSQSSITTSGGLFAEHATLTNGLTVTGGFVGIGTSNPVSDLTLSLIHI